MELLTVRALRGPNVWSRLPVLEAEVELKALAGSAEASSAPRERLAALLHEAEGLIPGSPAPGTLREAASAAHVLGRLTLALQRLAGCELLFVHARPASDGRYRVAVAYEEEDVGRACLAAAHALCLSAAAGQPCDVRAEASRLRELALDVRLGPSTAAIVRAARRRNIPVRRLNRHSLVQLGHGIRQRRICTAETDRTPAIAETIARDKELTRSLLRSVGVPVPEGRPVADAEDAWQAARELGGPVVVKPQYGNHGRGVATNLTSREQVLRAYAAASEEGEGIVVERFIPGDDYRLLVVGDRLAAAARREPAQVIGDGRSTVTALVAEVNRDPRRADGHATVLSRIRLDTVALAVLADQGFTPDSVPPAGVRVLIRRNGNLSSGGTALDVTDRVHPEVAARAIDAARVVGLDIAGVDVVALDIGRPLEEQDGAVVEVNAGPGLRMHLEPSAGQPRAVGEDIVSLLFPAGETGRIPVAAVMGSRATKTSRLLAHLLRRAGRIVGLACGEGAWVDGRLLCMEEGSGPGGARVVLLHPRAEAAVLETGRAGILREGLGFDLCDVAVVFDVAPGEAGEERGRPERTLVETVAAEGTVVLNADELLTAGLADHCQGSVSYFSRRADHPLVSTHRAGGGRAAFVREGWLVLAEGRREERAVPLARVSVSAEIALAAAAAATALGLALDEIRAGLESFSSEAR
jgi:cyanophycin synthetase